MPDFIVKRGVWDGTKAYLPGETITLPDEFPVANIANLVRIGALEPAPEAAPAPAPEVEASADAEASSDAEAAPPPKKSGPKPKPESAA